MSQPLDLAPMVYPVGKECTKCGRVTHWPDAVAMSDKAEREGHKIERKIVRVICDDCYRSKPD